MVEKVGIRMKLSKYGKRVVRNFLMIIITIALVIGGVLVYKNFNKGKNNQVEPHLTYTLEDGLLNGLTVQLTELSSLDETSIEDYMNEFNAFVKSLQFNVVFVKLENDFNKDALSAISKDLKTLGIPLYVIDETEQLKEKEFKKYKIVDKATISGESITFGEYSSNLVDAQQLKDPLASALAFEQVKSGTVKGFVFKDYDAIKKNPLEIGLMSSNLLALVPEKKTDEASIVEYFHNFETVPSEEELSKNRKSPIIGSSNKPVIKGARMVAALGSVLTDPTRVENIKSTVVKGSVMNVVGSTGSGEELAYELSTGDYLMAKYTEEIPAVNPFVFSTLKVDKENGTEVLTFGEEGTPLQYISKTKNELIVTFVDASFNGEVPVIEEGLFKGLSIENKNDNMEVRVPLGTEGSWGYLVDYSDNTIQIRLKAMPVEIVSYFQPLKGQKIVVDPGHGGEDPGSLNPQGGKTEAQVNLELSAPLIERLELLGAEVITTRTNDSFVSLWDRVNIFNNENADYFVSVHHNASVSRDVNGVEMYYVADEDAKMSELMSRDLSAITERKNRGPYQGIQYVLRSSLGPSVLVEAGFMSENTEFKDLQDEKKQILSAGTIADNVVKDLQRRISSSR